ncbi:hypothetical protein Baya_7362 [Bagarius yarrelli]|uniref:Uncharacterized protein n=1 Tax=Bagarius yarrelli TaxID=175774 RepID=A0A556U1U3_BAGYA|nr:hypothetical protein Baya_7362 [Bagarius yarrelli]
MGRTQFLKLVAAEADRVLPSLLELEQKGSRDNQPRAALKADHFSHKLSVLTLLIEDEMICAVKGAIGSNSAEKKKREREREEAG